MSINYTTFYHLIENNEYIGDTCPKEFPGPFYINVKVNEVLFAYYYIERKVDFYTISSKSESRCLFINTICRTIAHDLAA